ncbi:MAG: metallophosphatase [Prevotella sp.]|nr:metallophosphatase [Prevotella sp.]
MRHKLSFVILSLLLAAVTMAAGAKTRQKELLVLHTNDTHSCVMPLSANLADTLVAGRGGYLRRLAAINAERRQDPDLLLFDSGDFSQGSAYYTMFKGEVEVGLMNRMGYDAATIGNHEFDFGLENMARLFSMATFPIVCANYDFTGTPVEGLVKPYVILKRKGLKIGVFGLAPEMDGLVTKANCEGVKYLDPVQTALNTATKLKLKEKCDVVVCLSHLGWNMGPKLADDAKMIAGSRYIDIVLGGHSHTYFQQLQTVKDLDGRIVPDDQNGKHAVFVGRIKLTLNAKH